MASKHNPAFAEQEGDVEQGKGGRNHSSMHNRRSVELHHEEEAQQTKRLLQNVEKAHQVCVFCGRVCINGALHAPALFAAAAALPPCAYLHASAAL